MLCTFEFQLEEMNFGPSPSGMRIIMTISTFFIVPPPGEISFKEFPHLDFFFFVFLYNLYCVKCTCINTYILFTKQMPVAVAVSLSYISNLTSFVLSSVVVVGI